MDTTTLIWIVVAIIVVLVIVGIIIAVVTTSRGRREHRMETQHNRAEQMRNDARETAIKAQQHEAEAARARADAAAAAAAAEDAKARAAQASVDAQRRAGTIDDHRTEAEKLRAQEAETRQKADHVDPYVQDGTATRTDPVDDRARAGYDSADARDTADNTPVDRADAAAADRADVPDPRVEQTDGATGTPPITRRTR